MGDCVRNGRRRFSQLQPLILFFFLVGGVGLLVGVGLLLGGRRSCPARLRLALRPGRGMGTGRVPERYFEESSHWEFVRNIFGVPEFPSYIWRTIQQEADVAANNVEASAEKVTIHHYLCIMLTNPSYPN
jgi:hypothetical protein